MASRGFEKLTVEKFTVNSTQWTVRSDPSGLFRVGEVTGMARSVTRTNVGRLGSD